MNRVYLYSKVSISDKVMSKVMYAMLITETKIENSFNLGLEKYTRKQNSGALVDVVFSIHENKVDLFKELSGLDLKSSDDFQGKFKLN